MDIQTKEHINIAITPGKDDVASSLGITEERREDLCDIIKTHFDSNDDVTLAMQQVAATTNNHNELAFSMFIMGVWSADRRRATNPMEALAAMLGKALSAKDFNDDDNN